MISEAENRKIRRLADLMARARDEVPPRPFPVLLGALVAPDIGVPSLAAIGRKVFTRLTRRGRTLLEKLPRNWPDSSDHEVAVAFDAWLQDHSPMQRYAVLEPFLRSVPVPLFYRDLAELVVSSHVTRLLTTQVDTLLEQALESTGMRRDTDFEVLAPREPGAAPRPAVPPAPAPPVAVVKLAGDLARGMLPMGEETTVSALAEADALLGAYPPDGLIVVGHEPADPPQALDRWLADWPGELWWVGPSPGPDRLAELTSAGRVNLLEGEELGKPAGFLGRLTFHLNRLPALDAADALPAAPAELTPEELEYEYYTGQLRNSRAVSYTLEQRRVPGRVEESLEQRVRYQRGVEEALERRVRSSRPGVARGGLVDAVAVLLDDLASEAGTVGPDRASGAAVDFLATQADFLRREADTGHPDRVVVRGAIEAATVVAHSLGDAVPPTLRARLATAARQFSEGGPP
ncbi:hypothetical protein [Kitasatospora camelliae]|uniref:Uncharacterized protein n=1 Tax=Kitasatospora camelliae TaxID=3156397 RepID=A0AAU8K352_9ACTN